ncbi:GNAT family N-acetyltransferase [Streptomyces sp. HNM0575]|uniref:GNAT family N-acetyltransferase n=1 Tax=Streptomyces sp. HNM0575 TaxID=2716338 RepID=UPI00145E342E|nr:GNAT family N-acetyltransferase [Streptomyces sp. HNM0575]NLU72400.1 GNAT family N-acetyltransferase [Streptomyces sp. HNM0575]
MSRTWTIGPEAVGGEDAVALQRAYLDEVVTRYYGRPATREEVDEEFAGTSATELTPPRGLFLVARGGVDGANGEDREEQRRAGAPAGCAGVRLLGPRTAEPQAGELGIGELGAAELDAAELAALERKFAELAAPEPKLAEPEFAEFAAPELKLAEPEFAEFAEFATPELKIAEPKIAELTRVWVRPEARRGGLGSRLLTAAEHAAASLGAKAIRLDTRSDLVEARRLYARHGYAEIPPYKDDPYSEHFFEKRLG